MAVDLTISKTLGGSAPTDALSGGGLGYDFGDSEGGSSTTPIQNIYVRHNGTNEITNFAINLELFSDTYGGDYSPSSDLAKIVAQGDTLSTSAGLWADEDALKGVADTFDQDWVFRTGIGDLFTSRKLLPAASMAYNNAGILQAASGPTPGTLGPTANTVFGDTCHFRLRHYMTTSDTGTGVRQFDIYFSYNFTS